MTTEQMIEQVQRQSQSKNPQHEWAGLPNVMLKDKVKEWKDYRMPDSIVPIEAWKEKCRARLKARGWFTTRSFGGHCSSDAEFDYYWENVI